MKTDLKDVNSFTKELEVQVGWEMLKDGFEKELNHARSNYELKGFRKGKVPMNIVKKNMGPSVEAHYAEHALNDYYRKALGELKMNPINQAEILKLDFKEGGNLEFTARFEVYPDIKLPNYQKKFKIETTHYTARDEDVDDSIAELQERFSTVNPIKDGAKSGHLIQGDFQELDDSGMPVIGKKMENQYIKLGTSVFSGDAEKVFIGKNIDEVVRTEVQHDDDKKVIYEVKIKKIEEQVLPELNDDFVKMVDEEAETMDQLREKIKLSIQKNLEDEHSKAKQNAIIAHFVKKSKLEAPDSMLKHYLDHLIEDMKQKNQGQEIGDESKLREMYNDLAIEQVKWFLIKDELIEKEELKVADEDVQKKIDEISEQNPTQKSQITSFYKQAKNRDQLVEALLIEQLFDKLETFTNHKIVEKSTKELPKGRH